MKGNGVRAVKIVVFMLVVSTVIMPMASADTLKEESPNIGIFDKLRQSTLDAMYGDDVLSYDLTQGVQRDGGSSDVIVVLGNNDSAVDSLKDDFSYDNLTHLVAEESDVQYRVKGIDSDDVVGGFFYGFKNLVGMETRSTLATADYVERVYYNHGLSVGNTMDKDNEALKDKYEKGVTTQDIREHYGINSTTRGEGGRGVDVAVLDTGVRYNEDIGAYDFNATNETNGKLHVETTFNNMDGLDYQGHGSHVVSTINGQKVSKEYDEFNSSDEITTQGLAPNSTVHSIQVLDKDGRGAESNIVEGIEIAIDNDVDIISMSLGGMMPPFSALYDSIKRARANDIVVIAAAGNSGVRGQYPLSPAVWNGVIAVGSCTDSGYVSFFSNLNFDVMAIGHDVTAPAYHDDSFSALTLSGTSMATPVVSGIVANWLSDNPEMRGKAGEITDILTDTGGLDNPDDDNSVSLSLLSVYSDYHYGFPEVSYIGMMRKKRVSSEPDSDEVSHNELHNWRVVGKNI